MVNLLSVAVGAGLSLIGVVFGSWFTARRQDRMWLRDQKLKAGVGSALYLLCANDTVELADALARRVWSARPSEGREDRKAEHRETLDLLSRFTRQLRHEIANT